MNPRDTAAPGSLAALLDGYGTPPGHYDEMLWPDRSLRPWWRDFAGHAGEFSAESLAHAEARVARQVHGNGVTYNVYADGDGLSRPWTLDVLPFIVPETEWEWLARGLRQRARLMNALAADLYGAQTVLSEGLVPPSVVFGHPGFLHGCRGVAPPGGVFLHLAAFDLARGPDGLWRVGGSRVQAPSGAGYALENRGTVSRVFPDAFRALRVQPIAPFFDALQDLILAQAPTDGEVPRAVLLTPGPYSETYFEHAFLSKHLGFPLVEGGDLTVRRDRLFVKTVSGLRRVHAVLRRLDDDYCDPLELRSDSTLGVPGLLQAWRAGQVLVANAFGTGVLESPSLTASLPSVCERLLGEPLALPSVDSSGAGPAGEIEPPMPFSHAPVWHDGHLRPRALMLRVFLVADGAGDYRPMTGGLARIAGEADQVVSGQRGGGSKDTWVLSSVTSNPQSAGDLRLRGDDRAQHDRTTSSRAAEHLFWLGRYAERSENCARLVRAALLRFTEADAVSPRLQNLFLATGRRHGLLPHARPADDPLEGWDGERALIDSVLEHRAGLGLGFNIDQTIRVAGAVRDRLSSDNWRILSRLSDQFATKASEAREYLDLDEALDLVDQAILALVAVGGLEMAHMTRDDGWRFLTLGRHLERVWFVGITLEEVSHGGGADDPAVLEWLLELSDSLITYRARHARHPEWRSVVDLLLLDAHNPRSGAFQLSKLAKHVRLLPDANLAAIKDEIDRLVEACRPADQSQGILFDQSARIDTIVAGCRGVATRLGEALTLTYFNHVYERPHTTVAR